MKCLQLVSGEKGLETVPVNYLHKLPVIEAGPLQIAIIGTEPKWTDEMQDRLGSTAQSSNTPGVGRNFWLNQNDVEWRGVQLYGVVLGRDLKKGELLIIN